jgi:hypothetical protein
MSLYPPMQKPLIVNGEEYWRAALGVDGNCAYALLGPNLQEGEVEFFEIQPASDKNKSPITVAMGIALRQLRDRLKMNLDFYIDPDPRSKEFRAMVWKVCGEVS